MHDCDINGVAQLANEIALEDQERAVSVRPRLSLKTETLLLPVAWGNTGLRAMTMINNHPEKFVIDKYKLGYIWVSLYTRPLTDLKLWQGLENNSHSYHRSASDLDNLESFKSHIREGMLDTPEQSFDDMPDLKKKKVAKKHVRKWLLKSSPKFATFWRTYAKTDELDFKVKSYTPEELQDYCSKVDAFGMIGDKTWKDCAMGESNIRYIFKDNGKRIKVCLLSCKFASKGASIQHAWSAVHVKGVADEAHFIVAVEGCNNITDLNKTRQKIVDELKEFNDSIKGEQKFVHKVWFANQCMNTEVFKNPKKWALIETL